MHQVQRELVPDQEALLGRLEQQVLPALASMAQSWLLLELPVA